MGVRRGVKTGANPGGVIAPPKTYELTLFTTIVYNSENYFVIHCFVTEVF